LQPPTPSTVRAPRIVEIAAARAEHPARMLLESLAGPRPSIPPRFFYDDLGSRLFAAITALDEYYPTRTEAQLMAEHLPAIAAACNAQDGVLIDLGAGDCRKAARLLPVLRPACYVAVDISVPFLRRALDALQREFLDLAMLGVGADFAGGLTLPASLPTRRRLFFYPGSSIGNFTPAEAVAFLRGLCVQLDGDGGLLIGVDLVKDRAVLERAYDDSLGVTAAFNKNVLRNVNRIAGTDFELDDWRHVAFFAGDERRIEMHLEAVRDVAVAWPGGARRFAAGERIHTENSYKYTVESFAAVLAEAGFATAAHWTDARGWFAVFLARPRAACGANAR
jgi:dimethylhistidine N-methyltransferase